MFGLLLAGSFISILVWVVAENELSTNLLACQQAEFTMVTLGGGRKIENHTG